MNKGAMSGRRCIPPGVVARRLHTPGMRAPRASPGGRVDAQDMAALFVDGSVLVDEASRHAVAGNGRREAWTTLALCSSGVRS